MELIDKNKVIAEIERVRNWFVDHNYQQSTDLLDNLLVTIDKLDSTNTLEEE